LGKKVKLEINVPISPTPGFLNRLHYLIRSWELTENSKLHYRFIVTVGADQEPSDLSSLAPWLKDRAIEIRWIDRQLFKKYSWVGTGLERLRQSYEADMVLLADADILFSASIDEAVQSVPAGGLAGVMAYASPFFNEKHPGTTEEWWQRIFAAANLSAPRFCHAPSMARPEGHDRSPIYFNFGFLLLSPKACNRLGEIIFDEIANVNSVLQTFFRTQIGLTLAIERLNMDVRTLPLRFNHPLGYADNEFRDEWQNARIFHYTGDQLFSASRDGESETTVENWLQTHRTEPLSGVNGTFFRTIDRVHAFL
jgi:hypothetical protein